MRILHEETPFSEEEKKQKRDEIKLNVKVSANRLDRCYDFKNIFAEIFGENIGVFSSNYG
jgi:hypothetical protein